MVLTPSDKVDNKLYTLILLKMAERSKEKKREAKLRVRNQTSLRFDLLASLRSALFIKSKVQNLLVTLPAEIDRFYDRFVNSG